MSNIKIISDGTAKGTKVLAGATEVLGIKRIVIDPILPEGFVQVNLTLILPALEMLIDSTKIKVVVE